MSALALAGQTPRGESLEQLLAEMLKYGKPSIHYIEGWTCKVEMNTNAKGASFEIRSDFRMTTATAAVEQCLERIEQAVKTIGGVA